jgi:WD40 repeat protein
MKKAFFSAFIVLVSVLLQGQSPRLVIPFGHAQGVTSAVFSPNGQLILTVGNDGTVKLWDLKGRVIQTFTAKAAIQAGAFSPDGKTILTGSTDNTATLWEITGRELQAFIGHSYWVEAVAFAPDGKSILTGSTDGTAKLWDMNGKTLQTFDAQSDGVTAVRAAAFSPDGRTILLGGGELEGRWGAATLWDLSGKKLQTFAKPYGEVGAVAFSPDGQRILTGSTLGVKLWDVKGNEKKSFTGQSEGVFAAAFSPDGKTILTGHKDGTAKLWREGVREPAQIFNGHTDWVTTVAFAPDGNTVLTGSWDGVAKLWSLTGQEIQAFKGHTHKISEVAFSTDGMSVMTRSTRETKTGSKDLPPLQWALTGSNVRPVAGQTDWVNPGRIITSLALSPDGKTKLRSDFKNNVLLQNLADSTLQTFVGHTGFVAAVAFSPDGKMALTGSSDGTAKIWNLAGRELATLVVLDSTDWVVTAPGGLFDASPGAMYLMHFVVDMEVVELEQLKERYYEPGLLGKLLGLNQDPLRSTEAFKTLPLYPEMTARLSADQLKLQVTLKPRNGGIGKLSLFVNGKEVLEDANPERSQSVSIDLTRFTEYYLPGASNKLALRVYNQAGWLKSAALELDYRAPAKVKNPTTPAATGSISSPLPALHAIVVGTANYAGDKLDLKFADHDATSFAQALRAATPKVFGDRVFVTLLHTDADDTTRQDISSKTNIKKAFSNIVAKARAQDVLLVYFSGHGVNYGDAENGQFYYLTKDIAGENLSDPEIRTNYAISSSELTEWIKAIPAHKQVMVIDACNSGKMVQDLAAGSKDLSSTQIRALDRMKDRTGMFILTGSAADKVSYEAGQYGQGLLTYSLLQGMSGLALSEDKRVDVMTLFQYSRDKVPDLAKGIGGIQTPVLAFPVSGASFDIGIVDAQTKIPLAQVKPVFIRNVFQDEDRFDDVLGLADALEKYFRELTAKGAQAEIIFVDVQEYEDAYSIKGRYKVTGEAVEVRGRLFKGKTPVGEAFTVTGKKNDLPGLVEAMVEQVSGMLD